MKKEIRKCDECMKPMQEGFVIQSGAEYYCCISCLYKNYTPKEFKEMYDSTETTTCWTQWESVYF